jgi:hypothetical protein
VENDGEENVTQLLSAWNSGDRAALDRLMPIVYDELRQLARRHMCKEDETDDDADQRATEYLCIDQATQVINNEQQRRSAQPRQSSFPAKPMQSLRQILWNPCRSTI